MIACWLAATLTLIAAQKAQSPAGAADLRLELEQVGLLENRSVVLRCTIVNRGKGPIFLAPGFLNGELLQVRFTDAGTGRRIRFEGDDIAINALLSPEENVSLNPGMYVGIEKAFKLRSVPSNITARGSCSFENFDHYKMRKLWEGELVSKIIEIR